MLGVWHAILVRLGAVRAWLRTVIRVALALVILAEVARFVLLESLPLRTRGLPMGELQHAVQESMGWTLWLDTGSIGLVGVLVLLLLALSILRAVRGSTPTATPAEPPASD